jgi:hypothetical protein
LFALALLSSCRQAKKPEETEQPAPEEVPATPRKLDTIAIHRFWDTRLREFVYTYGEGEPADWRKSGNFNRETIIGSAAATPQPGTVRLYRAYCRDQRHYFYITKPVGATDIERIESFEVYVWTKPGDGRIAIHACFLPDDKDAYFDSSLQSIMEYVDTTLKERGPHRKPVQAMFYLYPPPPGSQQPKSSQTAKTNQASDGGQPPDYQTISVIDISALLNKKGIKVRVGPDKKDPSFEGGQSFLLFNEDPNGSAYITIQLCSSAQLANQKASEMGPAAFAKERYAFGFRPTGPIGDEQKTRCIQLLMRVKSALD